MPAADEDVADEGHISITVQGSGYLLSFPELAAFSLSEDGCRIGIIPGPGCNGETLTHLLLDQVLPRVLGHRGLVVLHGGAVAIGGGAIAFLGPSGVGKSTLAASFHQADHALLSDDGLVLSLTGGTVQVRPTYRSLRLWPSALEEVFTPVPPAAAVAHYSSKRRIELPASSDAPCRLLAAFILAEQDDDDAGPVAISRLGPADTLMALMPNVFRLDVADHGRLAPLFEQAGDIAAKLPAFTLAYPHDFATLPAVRDAILHTLNDLEPAA